MRVLSAGVGSGSSSSSNSEDLSTLARQLVKSKRVAFVVGAGISTASGIPDFRTAHTGLFASLKEKNPDAKLASGKDLFHSNLFQRTDTTRAFYMMIAELKRLADAAGPTDFHLLMRELEDANKLLRIYTQNIDALEAKTGLSYGLGEWKEVKRPATSAGKSASALSKVKGKGGANTVIGIKRKIGEIIDTDAATTDDQLDASESASASGSTTPFPSTSRLPATMPESWQPSSSFFTIPSFSQPLSRQSSSSSVVPDSQSQGPPPTSTQQDEVPLPDVVSVSSSTADSTLLIVPDSESPRSNLVATPAEDESSIPSSSQSSTEDAVAETSVESILTDLADLSTLAEDLLAPPSSQQSFDSSCEEPPSSSQAFTTAIDSKPKASRGGSTKRSLTIPRVIPLHGTLDEMHCLKCKHIEPVSLHLNTLASGQTIYCPRCCDLHSQRNALGERSRGIGAMKVSVVLYGEEHAQAARVGEIAEKDLMRAARPDFLIVAGTTLKIPGVKKLVKELAKVIRPDPLPVALATVPVTQEDSQSAVTVGGELPLQNDQISGTAEESMASPSAIPSTTDSVPLLQEPASAPAASWEPKVIFVNNDAPSPESVWNTVFDTFVQGDIQDFANIVRRELKLVKEGAAAAAALQTTKKLVDGNIHSMFQVNKPMQSANVQELPAKKLQAPTKPKNLKIKFIVKAPSKQPKLPAQAKTVKRGKSQAQKKKSTSPSTTVIPLASIPSTPVTPPSPKKEKEKCKPGWKGWGLVLESEMAKPKNADYFFGVDKSDVAQPLSKRRAAQNAAGRLCETTSRKSASSSAKAASQTPSTANDTPCPVVSAASGMKESVLETSGNSATKAGQSLQVMLKTAFSSLKGANSLSMPIPSEGPSRAVSPPSLTSDSSTISDPEDTCSEQGGSGLISDSTQIVPMTESDLTLSQNPNVSLLLPAFEEKSAAIMHEMQHLHDAAIQSPHPRGNGVYSPANTTPGSLPESTIEDLSITFYGKPFLPGVEPLSRALEDAQRAHADSPPNKKPRVTRTKAKGPTKATRKGATSKPIASRGAAARKVYGA